MNLYTGSTQPLHSQTECGAMQVLLHHEDLLVCWSAPIQCVMCAKQSLLHTNMFVVQMHMFLIPLLISSSICVMYEGRQQTPEEGGGGF